MAGKWDESKVKRDAGGRFSRSSGLSGSGLDKFNQLKARHQARAREVRNSPGHQQGVDLMNAQRELSRSTPGYQQNRRSYASIKVAGSAGFKLPGAARNRNTHSALRTAGNARGNTPRGLQHESVYNDMVNLGNARGRAAIANDSRRTTKAQKTKAQRDYEKAKQRFYNKYNR